MIDYLVQQNNQLEPDRSGLAKGLVVGRVTNNVDPEGLGRVRLQLPWLPEEQDSQWARVATPMAMPDRGMFFLPEVGDEVLVGFEQGKPEHPFVLGSLWNGQARPPADNADDKNEVRVIRTRSGSELRFTDAEKPSVEVKLEDGKHLLMDEKGVVLEDGQGNTLQIETNSGAMKIISSQKLELSSAQVEIKASGTMKLNSGGTMTINGQLVQIN